MTTATLLTLLGAFGLVVGSFLNVVIVRVPAGESILRPPSRCPRCHTPIAARDNVPVLSWLILRGRCRGCGEPIPAGYPLVEAGNALLWVLAGLRFGATGEALAYAALFSVLLVLSVIDAELMILPNAITYPAAVASFLGVVPLALGHDDPLGKLAGAWLSGLGFAGFLLALLLFWERVLDRDGMGGGDVKLALTLGVWLGYLHPVLVVLAVLAASLLGTLVGLVVIAVRRRNEAFPFGPWLALGAVAVILAADPLLGLYDLSAA